MPPPTVSLSLDEAVAMALRNNLALRSSLIDEEIERTRIREALGAFDPTFFTEARWGQAEVLFAAEFPLDPTQPASPTVTRVISTQSDEGLLQIGMRGILETGLSYELTFTTDYSRRDEQSGLNPIFNNSTRLSFTQPLLSSAWASYREAPVELAQLSSLDAHQTYRASVATRVREVQGAYYDLVFALADLEVKKQSLTLAEQQVELTRVRVESGALPQIEITSAESGRAGRRVDLVEAEAAVVATEDRLRREILSFDQEGDWQVHLVPTERAVAAFVELRPLDEIVDLAELTEPGLLRAELAVAQAEVVLRQRQSERQHRLDLSGSASFVGLDDELLRAHRLAFNSDRGAATWSLGLVYEVPLGNRAAEARLAQGELALRRARIDRQNARTELVFQVRSTLRNIEVARRSIAARQEATRLAEEQLGNERLRLELRTSTNFQVFEVEDQLNRRRTEEIRAVIDYRMALLDLCVVTGIPLSELVASG